MIARGKKMLYTYHNDRRFKTMRCSLFIGALAVSACFSVVAIPVSEVAKLNGVQCSPLTISDEWREEIRGLLNATDISGKPYLIRVSEALETVNQAQVGSKTLYGVSSTIRMSICDFPTQYQAILRKIVINLVLRAAMEGEKDAIYDMMDTYPLQQDLTYVSTGEEGEELSTDDFKEIRESLEESDIDETFGAEQLKEIVGNALSKAKSAPNSPVASLHEVPTKEVHSDSEI